MHRQVKLTLETVAILNATGLSALLTGVVWMCTRPLPGVLLIVVSVTADVYNTSDNYFTILIWIGCAALAAGAYVSFLFLSTNTLIRAHARSHMPPTCIRLRFAKTTVNCFLAVCTRLSVCFFV